MKRIRLPKLKAILGVFVMCLFTVQLSAEGYDSTYVLSIKQKFAIPEDVNNGDYVGQWKKTYTWNSKNTITFAIKTNFNSAFSINSTSGLITIADASKIKGKIVRKDTVINLVIRSTDSKIGYEDDTCEIRVKESAYCKFIDYTYTGTKTGKRTQPYSDLSSVTVTAGYAYFFKRGNKPLNKKHSISGVKATSASPTILGAYGTGNNPEFDGAGLSSADGLFYFLGTPSPSEYVKIYNIDIKNYPASALRIATRSRSFGIYNCNYSKNLRVLPDKGLADVYLYGSDADTLKNWQHELINLESAGSGGPILKTDASGVYAYNIKSAAAVDANFRFAISYYSRLSHFHFIGGSRSLQTRYPSVVITDGIITGSAEAAMFLVTDQIGKPEKLRINNVLFKGNENGILTYNININNTVIENCRFEANKYDGINFRNGGNGRVIQNCSFINNGSDGIELLKSTQATNNLSIYYNVFIGNKGKAINAANASCGSNIKIYNNTIIGIVDLSGATNETVRNNFYQSLTSATTSSNNITLGSINQSAYFKNPAAKDYRLISTASSAIDKGYLVGLSYDCLRISISGNPDIGAYEYKAQSQSAVNNTPIINNQSFTIQEQNFQSKVGTVIASDLDEEQRLSYSIISGNDNGFFTIDSSTGAISATSANLFNGETSSYVLTVQVTDDAETPATAVSSVTITLVGKEVAIINTAPSVNNQSFNISEENFSGSFIGIIAASDIDAGQELSYTIISGNEDNIFSLNEKTGELITTTPDVFSSSPVSHTLEVEVADNAQDKKSARAQIVVDFVAKTITSTETITASTTLNVYPNPSKGNINIEINTTASGFNSTNNTEISILEIIDLAGKTVKSKTIEDNENLVEENFDLSDLPNGLYSVRLKMANQVTTKKLILNR